MVELGRTGRDGKARIRQRQSWNLVIELRGDGRS